METCWCSEIIDAATGVQLDEESSHLIDSHEFSRNYITDIDGPEFRYEP